MVPVAATATEPGDPDGLDLGRLRGLAVVARNEAGFEYLALSDGWRRIRLDVVEGTLGRGEWVKFDYRLTGFDQLEHRLLTLRRLAALRRDGRLADRLFPVAAALPRRLEALRVADALRDRAPYRDIAVALYGETRVRSDWRTRSDYLLSKVRRHAAEARQMLAGGYRALFGR